LKGKIAKRDVLCLFDTRASHNFITRESVERMQLHLEKLKAPIEVHFTDGVCIPLHHKQRKLERKGAFVGFHNGLCSGNGVHHPKQCAHRRAQID
jgi:hypothetical protein